MKRSYRKSANVIFDGIGLLHMNFGDQDADFQEVTQDALSLIRRTDPRRYSIVVRELRYIGNTGVLCGVLFGGIAFYHRWLRACTVDFGSCQLKKGSEHYEWYLAWYAACLVHEATHGRLESLCFPYTKRTKARIERICTAEQCRFACRIASNAYDFSTLVPPFDETNWHYPGIITRLKDWLRRMRKSRQRGPKL